MAANIEYQLHQLVGTIDDLGTSHFADGEEGKKNDAVFRPMIKMHLAEGEAELINVFVPAAIDSWLEPGLKCNLYVVEAEAKVCSPAHDGCAMDGPFCHVFAIDTGQKCLSAASEAVDYFDALKRLGVDMVMSWAGLAVLVSFVLIGIPLLIYLGVLAVMAMAVRVPSGDELRRFLGHHGFPACCDCAA
jgi:hypothetical protein